MINFKSDHVWTFDRRNIFVYGYCKNANKQRHFFARLLNFIILQKSIYQMLFCCWEFSGWRLFVFHLFSTISSSFDSSSSSYFFEKNWFIILGVRWFFQQPAYSNNIFFAFSLKCWTWRFLKKKFKQLS
jgi:hypothetical protein